MSNMSMRSDLHSPAVLVTSPEIIAFDDVPDDVPPATVVMADEAASPTKSGLHTRKENAEDRKRFALRRKNSSNALGKVSAFFDKAVKYFDDSYPNPQDDVYILGVRHPPIVGIEGSASTSTQRASASRRSSSSSKTKDSVAVPENAASTSPAPSITSSADDYMKDFFSRIALTYRTGFVPISRDLPPWHKVGAPVISQEVPLHASNSFNQVLSALGLGRLQRSLTTDTGWGCMLRTGQSVLANALVMSHLGRNWRRTSCTDSEYNRILAWFADDPRAPFSVHQFASQGASLGKEIGSWFGPSTAAGAICELVKRFPQCALGAYSAVDGAVYSDFLAKEGHWGPSDNGDSDPEADSDSDSDTLGNSRTAHKARPVLLLVNVRLGLDQVNAIYYDTILDLFRLPQTVGISGGRPSSSFYFIGATGQFLLYADPHNPRPALPYPDIDPTLDTGAFSHAYSDAQTRSCHPDRVRRMHVSSLDPSMLLAFLIQDAADWDDFQSRLAASKSAPLFTVAKQVPAWLVASQTDGDVESLPDDWDDDEHKPHDMSESPPASALSSPGTIARTEVSSTGTPTGETSPSGETYAREPSMGSDAAHLPPTHIAVAESVPSATPASSSVAANFNLPDPSTFPLPNSSRDRPRSANRPSRSSSRTRPPTPPVTS